MFHIPILASLQKSAPWNASVPPCVAVCLDGVCLCAAVPAASPPHMARGSNALRGAAGLVLVQPQC